MATEPSQSQEAPSNSIEVGGFKIESSSASSEELQEQFAEEIEKDTKEAASKLGKKGAKAAAEKRAKEAEEQPEPAEEEPREAKGEESPEPKKGAKPDDDKTDEDRDEEQDSETKSGKEKKLGNPRHDPRARMLEATRKEAEAKRERDAALARVDELAKRLEALERGEKPQPKAEAPKGNGKPSAENFDDYESYLDARDDWNRQRWTEELQQRSVQYQQDRAFHGVIEKFQQSAQSVADRLSPDVLELKAEFQLQDGESPSGGNWIANELIFQPESAPALMLYLSEHPEDLQRIAALTTPRAVSREMAKLEARLEAANAGNGSERVSRSKAPPPPKPVQGGPYAAAADENVKPGEDFDSYIKRTGKALNPYR